MSHYLVNSIPDTRAPDTQAPNSVPDTRGPHPAARIPVELRPVPLRATLEGADLVLQVRRRRRRRFALGHCRAEERQAPALQVGPLDRMLQHEPGGVATIRSDEGLPRPAMFFEDGLEAKACRRQTSARRGAKGRP